MSDLVLPQDLARTYKPQSYEDAWDVVEDYQRVLEYTGRHPQKGSSAVSSALNMPRGRVHPWMNGSRPAPVRAIQIAEEHDWLPLTDEDSTFAAFNRLAAWIFSRGSISVDEYEPSFVCDTKEERTRLAELFDELEISYTFYRTEDTDRATEARITEHRTIIGRILSELGVPLGPREETRQLPTYLKEVSETHQLAFANTYLENKARYWEWQDGYVIRHESYTESYLQSLAALFTRLCDDPSTDTIEVNQDSLFLPSPVVEQIQTAVSGESN